MLRGGLVLIWELDINLVPTVFNNSMGQILSVSNFTTIKLQGILVPFWKTLINYKSHPKGLCLRGTIRGILGFLCFIKWMQSGNVCWVLFKRHS